MLVILRRRWRSRGAWCGMILLEGSGDRAAERGCRQRLELCQLPKPGPPLIHAEIAHQSLPAGRVDPQADRRLLGEGAFVGVIIANDDGVWRKEGPVERIIPIHVAVSFDEQQIHGLPVEPPANAFGHLRPAAHPFEDVDT